MSLLVGAIGAYFGGRWSFVLSLTEVEESQRVAGFRFGADVERN